MLAHYHEYLYYYKGTQLKIFLYTLYNHFCTELTMTNKKRGHSMCHKNIIKRIFTHISATTLKIGKNITRGEASFIEN